METSFTNSSYDGWLLFLVTFYVLFYYELLASMMVYFSERISNK